MKETFIGGFRRLLCLTPPLIFSKDEISLEVHIGGYA
jgi:hypothetical protein